MTQNFQTIDNKKYMWDGKVYENEADARSTSEEYKKNNFEVKLIQEEGKYLIYTRRLASTTQAS